MNASILIVDDERNVRLMYRAALDQMFTIEETDSPSKALEMLKGRRFNVAILDLRMPEMTGLELLEQMNHAGITTPVVIITAYADVPNAVSAMKFGAIDFLQKPITPEQLRTIVKDILVRHSVDERKFPVPHDFDYFLRCAKRAINLRDFTAARANLISALEIDPNSPQALNLAGVMFEMREEFDQAKRYYGRAIKVSKDFEPAQANMRRIYELFHFGSSQEPFNLENH
ncbi:MAG: response regulator [Chthoniobacteraceae bacterium]|jgi:DNA-binding response OmpR family regulator